jgi:hypothetical protein
MIDAALLLPTLLARAGDNADFTETATKIAWRRVAGEGLREYAIPVRLADGALIVSVADAVWQKQLQAMSAELIFRINKLMARKVVERVEFRIDARALKSNAGSRAATPRLSRSAPAAVISSAAEIEDPDLRERFLRAAENCISRRDGRKSASPQSAI